jgi:hypothetical protein
MSYTYAKWYYGHIITADNNYIDFSEGGPQISAVLRPGSYTLEEFADEIAAQMTAVSTLPQTYTASVNRASRRITISSAGTFQLLVSTGTHSGTSAFALAGFSGANKTGAATYTSLDGSGYEFAPQFPLQSLSDFSESKEYLDSSVNVAASGQVEVVNFGSVSYMDCEIKFQTNVTQANYLIKNDSSGFQNLKDFLEYAIKKGRMEFILDQAAPENWVKCILEKTPANNMGTAYQIMRMTSMQLWDYFETGSLRFREVL